MHGMSRRCTACHGDTRHVTEVHGMSRRYTEWHGGARDRTEVHGITRRRSEKVENRLENMVRDSISPLGPNP
jgi:hypothetical protein